MKDDTKTKAGSVWYQAAAGMAVVGAVFFVISGFVVAFSYYRLKVADVRLALQLEEMKTELKKPSARPGLAEEVRALDLRIRRDTFYRSRLLGNAGYVCIGSLAVLITGLRWRRYFSDRPYMPVILQDMSDRQVRAAMQARLAVTAGLVIIGSVALFFVFRAGGVDFTQVSSGGAPVYYATAEQVQQNWPVFRGPDGSGICNFSNIPADWDGKSGKGILWKSKVPLGGHNSPVVWGKRVFVSGADKDIRKIFCYDADSGALLWSGEVNSGSGFRIEVGEDTGYAASTAAVDGRRVCAIFANGDIGCFDFEGKRLWVKSMGKLENIYGYASSLAMYNNLVIVQYDYGDGSEGLSKVVALDWATGREVWRARRELPNSWTSPIVAKVDGRYELITCGSPLVIAYKPQSGDEIWRAQCVGGEVAPSPICIGGVVFAVWPYDKLAAVKAAGASGDVTATNILWQVPGEIPDICSPLSDGRLVWVVGGLGRMSCYNGANGSLVWEQQQPEQMFYASPCLVGQKIYITSSKGVTFIIDAGAEYKQLGRCELGEDVFASPAFSDGRIYIRGVTNIYCIGSSN